MESIYYEHGALDVVTLAEARRKAAEPKLIVEAADIKACIDCLNEAERKLNSLKTLLVHDAHALEAQSLAVIGELIRDARGPLSTMV